MLTQELGTVNLGEMKPTRRPTRVNLVFSYDKKNQALVSGEVAMEKCFVDKATGEVSDIVPVVHDGQAAITNAQFQASETAQEFLDWLFASVSANQVAAQKAELERKKSELAASQARVKELEAQIAQAGA